MPIEQLMPWIARCGYPAIFLLLVLGIVGLPVPDETLLTLTGYLIFRGTLQFLPSYVCAFLGTSCGITLSYCIGRFGGVRVIMKYGARFHVTQERLDRVHLWFSKWGHWSLTVGYFVPGIRHVIAIVAGSSRLEPRIFSLFAFSGAFVWAGVFICAGYYLGEGWEAFPDMMSNWAIVIFGVILLSLAAFWLWRRRRKKTAA